MQQVHGTHGGWSGAAEPWEASSGVFRVHSGILPFSIPSPQVECGSAGQGCRGSTPRGVPKGWGQVTLSPSLSLVFPELPLGVLRRPAPGAVLSPPAKTPLRFAARPARLISEMEVPEPGAQPDHLPEQTLGASWAASPWSKGWACGQFPEPSCTRRPFLVARCHPGHCRLDLGPAAEPG